MSQLSRNRPGTAAGIAILLGCLTAVLVFSGCETQAKSDADASASQERTANKPARTDGPGDTSTAEPGAADTASRAEKKPEKSEKTDADELARAIDRGEAPEQVDQDTLAALIRQRIMEARKQQEEAEQGDQQRAVPAGQSRGFVRSTNAEERSSQAEPPKRAPQTGERERENRKPPREAPKPTRPERDAKKGCGDTGGKLDLTPPPPDAPQPKLVVTERTVTAEPVWQGKQVDFEWEIRNEGEGPLSIQVRGG
jgi:hypothetical protein